MAEATRLVDICLEAGLTLFDSADGYSEGLAEEILDAAIARRRDKVLISTKTTFPTGPGPAEVGASRYHLLQAVEGSLRRLKTDHIDLSASDSPSLQPLPWTGPPTVTAYRVLPSLELRSSPHREPAYVSTISSFPGALLPLATPRHTRLRSAAGCHRFHPAQG